MSKDFSLISDKLNTYFKDRKMCIADSIPVSGTYKSGDLIIKSNPEAGTSIGWICISDGTPGEWSEISGGGQDIDLSNYVTIEQHQKLQNEINELTKEFLMLKTDVESLENIQDDIIYTLELKGINIEAIRDGKWIDMLFDKTKMMSTENIRVVNGNIVLINPLIEASILYKEIILGFLVDRIEYSHEIENTYKECIGLSSTKNTLTIKGYTYNFGSNISKERVMINVK